MSVTAGVALPQYPQGRESTISAGRCARILQNVAVGNYFKTAVTAAGGVTAITATRWAQRGEVVIEECRATNPDLTIQVMEWAEPRGLTTYGEDTDLWTHPDGPNLLPEKYREYWLNVLFSVLLTHARARATDSNVRSIRLAAGTDWRAAAWWLERTQPEEFGRREQVQVGGIGGGPLQLQQVPMEELVARVLELRGQGELPAGD